MQTYRIIAGVIAVLVAMTGYSFYLRDIFRNNTKPHAFSWLLWGIMEIIAFAAQVVKHGGPGAWVTGASSIITLFIFTLALTKGTRDFTRFDWIALFASLGGILLWWLTKDPTLSVILIATADAIAFTPTFRKGFNKPFEETLVEYSLSMVKHLIGISALQSFSIATWFYPASLVLSNGSFVSMMLIRRKHLEKTKPRQPI